MRIFKLKDTFIANKPFTVITDCTEKELIKWLRKTNKCNIDGLEETGADGRTIELVKGNKKLYYVWVCRIESTSPTIGLLVHELFHYACYQLNNFNIKFSKETEEVYAYYMSNLTHLMIDEILAKIQKGGNRGKRTRTHR